MKTTFIICILLLSTTVLHAQTFDGKKYIYKRAGIAFQIDKSFKVDTSLKPKIEASNKNQDQIISISISQEPYVGDPYKDYSVKEMASFKEERIASLKKQGKTVHSLEVTKGKYLNYNALFIVSHYSIGIVPIYEKQVLFVINGRYSVLLYFLVSEKSASKTKLDYLEKTNYCNQ